MNNKKDLYTQFSSLNYIERYVKIIRNELAKEYNIIEGEYKNYTGLCDKACVLLAEKLKRSYNIEFIHGEQRHNIMINPDYWNYEHTWLKVYNSNIVMYVDPTSGQFKWLHKDIPDYYISKKKPKWYYPDSKNLRFNKIICKIIEEKFRIIEFIQFEIWRNICKFIRRILK